MDNIAFWISSRDTFFYCLIKNVWLLNLKLVTSSEWYCLGKGDINRHKTEENNDTQNLWTVSLSTPQKPHPSQVHVHRHLRSLLLWVQILLFIYTNPSCSCLLSHVWSQCGRSSLFRSIANQLLAHDICSLHTGFPQTITFDTYLRSVLSIHKGMDVQMKGVPIITLKYIKSRHTGHYTVIIC